MATRSLIKPYTGMGVTVKNDETTHEPATIVGVTKKTIDVQMDAYNIKTDEIFKNINGPIKRFRLTKNGWISGNAVLYLGYKRIKIK